MPPELTHYRYFNDGVVLGLFLQSSLTHDIKLTFDFENGVSIYFDAINITEEVQAQYFEGNQFSNGKMMYRLDDYGRSFQIGLQASFF